MTTILTKSTQERVTEDQVQDSGDEALSLSMEKIKNSLEQTEIDELRLIDDALKRISRGEFGLCIDCGEAISEKRLENSPYAARCIVCQEAFEGQ
ncbi:MAG: TraR/DksA family transcriptional regulator [bacterium]